LYQPDSIDLSLAEDCSRTSLQLAALLLRSSPGELAPCLSLREAIAQPAICANAANPNGVTEWDFVSSLACYEENVTASLPSFCDMQVSLKRSICYQFVVPVYPGTVPVWCEYFLVNLVSKVLLEKFTKAKLNFINFFESLFYHMPSFLLYLLPKYFFLHAALF
jgi:hypothetical protein